MSLQVLAQHMAAQGRGPDSMLMHVAPDEVARLQAIARAQGGSLTINPETGLVEAGFFSGLKNAVGKVTSSPIGALALGAALGPAGWAGMSALGAAGTVGGLAALSTGSLKQGLISGLGAYGGANLYAGLTGAGASATGDAALNAGMDAKVKEAAAQSTIEQAAANQTAAETARLGLQQQVAQQEIANQAALEAAKQKAAQTSVTAALSNPELAYAGAKDIVTGGGLDALAAGMPKGTSLGYNAAAAAIPFANESIEEAKQANKLNEVKAPPSLIRPYTLTRNVRDEDMLGAKYQAGQNTGARKWFEDTWSEGTPYEAPGPEYKKMAMGGDVQMDPNMQQIPAYDPVVRMAGGGLGSLGGYSDGGRMLKGPGDGMSDSIPAMIGSKQPARLADGEFVVPADVVSHLGNGSTDAGAKQLYKMMDRVRQSRTGKKKQAPQVNTGRMLPA
jgi:hypothetical protein